MKKIWKVLACILLCFVLLLGLRALLITIF